MAARDACGSCYSSELESEVRLANEGPQLHKVIDDPDVALQVEVERPTVEASSMFHHKVLIGTVIAAVAITALVSVLVIVAFNNNSSSDSGHFLWISDIHLDKYYNGMGLYVVAVMRNTVFVN